MLREDGRSLDKQFAEFASAALDIRERGSVISSILNIGHDKLEGHQDNAFSIARSLSEISRTVSSMGFISKNDTMDDIATPKLKFLLLPYLEATALLACQGDVEKRLDCITQAKRLVEIFLDHTDDLEMLTERERMLLKELPGASGVNPGEQRLAKIARYKREKEAQRKLEELFARLKRYNEQDDYYEEHMREIMTMVIKSAIRRSFDLLRECEQEIEVLRYATEFRAIGQDPPKPEPKGPSRIPGHPANFTITNRRQQMREQVFRPSHSLPTYTVEEWGEFEAKRAREAAKKKTAAEAAEKERNMNEDEDVDDVIADKNTYKAREWDDWKDEHNKGSGNTLR